LSDRVIVRDAGEADLPAILDIYNNAVLNETSIWTDDTADLADRRAWWEQRVSCGFPVYVADVDGAIAGYGSFGEFRPHQGYRFTVEHSIYVATPEQRRGIGSVLLTRLIAEARRMNMHAMVGGIAADNSASIALHLRFGFVETARMPQVGFKFGRWLDLVLMQKQLD
jgi:phosphinothricin acetyltransferase